MTTGEFRYDDKEHRYYFGDLEVPGISACLKILSGDIYRGVKHKIMERAQNFGTAVHRTIELFEKGALDEHELSEPLVPILGYWKKLKDNEGLKTIAMEKPLGSKTWLYGGTPDFYGTNKKNEHILIEFKTTKMLTLVGPQLAAQAQLINENYGKKIERRFVFVLLPDTEYQSPEEQYDALDFKFFVAGLACWKFRRKNKLI